MARKRSQPRRGDAAGGDEAASPPRIVGGEFRGRKLLYSGDRRVRPMKDRVREAVFNLIGPAVRGTHAIDLFAGTGALGLEALSRGAASALFVERHFPTADVIRQNVETLGVSNRATILRTREGNAQYRVRLNDLLQKGDVSANVDMRPGDVLIIPESYF